MNHLHGFRGHTYQAKSRSKQKGFISALMLFAGMIMAYFAISILEIGQISMRVNNEKQLLDTHGLMVGQSIILNGIDETCRNGRFVGEMANQSRDLYGQLDENENDRDVECEDLEGELIERGEGDPDGPPGTFRRYRVRSTHNADGTGAVQNGTAREVIVEVREVYGEVEQERAQVMFLLDYSGSMNIQSSGRPRINSLREAMDTFVSQNYEMDYGVILYESNNRQTIQIGAGGNHGTTVMNVVNTNTPSGGTNYNPPIETAYQLLNQRESGEVYIVLISDGQPNNDPVPLVNQLIRGIDPQLCLTKQGNQKCVTIYTLGVDNADTNLLEDISGNAATPPQDREEFVFEANANQTQAAFNAIVEDILCRFGPLDPIPEPDDLDTLNVFVNELPLDVGIDYEYDTSLNMIKFFDEPPYNACSTIINGNGAITLRYGQPRLIVPDTL